MRLSIDLFSPSELPSPKKVQEIFNYAVEMGLDQNKFDHTHFHFVGKKEPHGERRDWIVLETSYKDMGYADDCLLTIVIEVKKDKPFGRFWIWDPVQGSNIAYSELLPYKEFVSLLKRAQDIGTLHQDIRARWYEWKGWKDLLPYVKHVGSQQTKE